MLKPYLLLTFIYTTLLSKEQRGAAITTTMIAEKLGVSQQTISRHLIELEQLNLIKRISLPRGERIKVTRHGWIELKNVYDTLGSLIEPPHEDLILGGVIFTGLGEGAYYVSQPFYRKQFQEKLGFAPYPGTLNIQLSDHSLSERKQLNRFNPIFVEGFSSSDRSFGSVNCYRAALNDTEICVIITALRTHYSEETLELISPNNLREKMKLEDGDHVTIRVFATPPPPSS